MVLEDNTSLPMYWATRVMRVQRTWGVTVDLQWCFRGVRVLLQLCYTVLQWCYSGLTVVSK
jgi:hypothetical protein